MATYNLNRAAVAADNVLSLMTPYVLTGSSYPGRVVVGSEVCYVIGGAGTSEITVLRGADGTLRASHGQGAAVNDANIPTVNGVAPVAPTIVSNKLGADVPLVNANQFYDGPSVALTPGTWVLTGAVSVLDPDGTPGDTYTAKLWDGTTVASSAFSKTVGGGLPVSAVVVVPSNATWKISIACDRVSGDTSQVIRAAAPANSAGNNVSFLYAVKIA